MENCQGTINENSDYTVTLYGDGSALKTVIIISGMDEKDGILKAVGEAGKTGLAFVGVRDWMNDLSPWEAEGLSKGEWFGGNGKKLLSYLLREIFPIINRSFPLNKKTYIAGYSLAGLFALWAFYESRSFDGAVCCSGSLWYPGWDEYASSRNIPLNTRIYLSLGKKEPLTKHPVMKTVGECTMRQYERFLNEKTVESVYIQNEGGHFTDPEKRLSYGIKWITGGCDRTAVSGLVVKRPSK